MEKLFIILLLICVTVSTAKAHTLQELYQAAVEFTAVIKQKKYSHEIAIEKKDQAIAQVLPSLTANSSNVWREEANVGAFGEGYQHTAYLSLTQPLFQGGAEYYSLSIAKNLPKIAELEKIQGEISLFTSVAEAFFDLLKLEQDKKTLIQQQKTLNERVATLSARAKIGRNKQTDVLAARSHYSRVTAELSLLESRLISARQKLINITGVKELTELKDDYLIQQLKVPADWDELVMQTPILKANEILVENALKEVKAANSNYLPSVDLDARYYLDRAGILRDSDWDVTVNAKWNLFSGGEHVSEKRIKKLEQMSLEAGLSDLKRNIKNDYLSLKNEFQMQQEVISKLQVAVNLAQENYKQNLREVDRGLINQLELLRVLEEYQQIRRSYDQQIYETKKTWVRLRALAGVRP